ncbi:MAG: hypothetical protein ACYTDT_14010 [Planctomycetota bacterium]
MKNFAIAVAVVAFGALMLTGCPGANNAKADNAGGNAACAPADNAGNAAE